ncbi:hypothetical protein S40285_10547 [Stachybotrys chlorohalonatus IBT 40285]|uniref:Uncharacterized protein n=1 Tax=Stachybotrys chlorohalonatus (strain IBT 40285) TaxID=1283841 RepID=A0A084QFD2_STAC4|nr:hypothetical protein S40285_10547 [Stachybotrys chlorohalonata IBT 40285]
MSSLGATTPFRLIRRSEDESKGERKSLAFLAVSWRFLGGLGECLEVPTGGEEPGLPIAVVTAQVVLPGGGDVGIKSGYHNAKRCQALAAWAVPRIPGLRLALSGPVPSASASGAGIGHNVT